MRWLFQVSIAAAVSAAVFVALATFVPAHSSQPAGGETIDESETMAAKMPAATRIFADGVLEGAHREIVLRFEVPGRIKAIYAREGAEVKAGDMLAELESDLAELRLAEAQTRLKIARAERDRFYAGRDRQAEPLNPDQTITEGQVTLAETAVRRELLLVEKLRLQAPIAGMVLRAAAEPGEYTGPSDERELFAVVDAHASRVRAHVEELDGLRIAPGQAAVISVAARPGQTFRGTVRACAPGFRPKAQHRLKPGERLDIRVREVVIDLDDGHDLLVGLPAEIFIEPGR
ncbi:MAG: efflux RND transporter periplasmic adaptor subunit [Pirellulales bacterium]